MQLFLRSYFYLKRPDDANLCYSVNLYHTSLRGARGLARAPRATTVYIPCLTPQRADARRHARRGILHSSSRRAQTGKMKDRAADAEIIISAQGLHLYCMIIDGARKGASTAAGVISLWY